MPAPARTIVDFRTSARRWIALAIGALTLFVATSWASPASAELAWSLPRAAQPADDASRRVERDEGRAPQYALAAAPVRLEAARAPRRAFGAVAVVSYALDAPARVMWRDELVASSPSHDFVPAPRRRRSLLMVFLN